jgi:hypothetical protein
VNAARAVSMAFGATADSTAPTVSITSPAAGATVSGTITVQVNASDNVGVAAASLSVGGTSLGTDNSSPYSFTWDTTTAANGTYTLTATATDRAGNGASTQVSVTVYNASNVDATPPSVSFASPANGATLSGSVTVTANVSDNVGVSAVDFYFDGVLKVTDVTSPYTFTWDTTPAANGPHTLMAVARDAAGNSASAQISVTVSNVTGDVSAPTISITSPKNGVTVSGTLSVTVSAADNVGVRKVELYVDGRLTATSTTAPFTTTWSARKAAKGAHTLQCKAYDAAGNVGTSAAVTVYK